MKKVVGLIFVLAVASCFVAFSPRGQWVVAEVLYQFGAREMSCKLVQQSANGGNLDAKVLMVFATLSKTSCVTHDEKAAKKAFMLSFGQGARLAVSAGYAFQSQGVF